MNIKKFVIYLLISCFLISLLFWLYTKDYTDEMDFVNAITVENIFIINFIDTLLKFIDKAFLIEKIKNNLENKNRDNNNLISSNIEVSTSSRINFNIFSVIFLFIILYCCKLLLYDKNKNKLIRNHILLLINFMFIIIKFSCSTPRISIENSFLFTDNGVIKTTPMPLLVVLRRFFIL